MVSDLVKIKPELESNEPLQTNNQPGFNRKLKPLEEVTCYKVINLSSLLSKYKYILIIFKICVIWYIYGFNNIISNY
jgi:hypothetical protein